MADGTAPSGPLASSALQGLLRDGELTGSWTLDPARSEVRLKTRHTWGLLPLTGYFRQVSGSGTITGAGDASGVITVAAASVDTKNKQRDQHLRSPDFFDVDNHPDITFAAQSATPAGDGLRFTGTLTVRGTARPVSFDARVSRADGDLSLDAEVPVNRADYGLTWNKLGIAQMQNTMVVHAVFTRA